MDELLTRHRCVYLTKHNTHCRHTSTSLAGFESIFSVGERQRSLHFRLILHLDRLDLVNRPVENKLVNKFKDKME